MLLSAQQESAVSAVNEWCRSTAKPYFYLAGYAGAGKTTLAKSFAGILKKSTRYAAYSGKAAVVMRKNGCADASTIHSMIYKVEIDPETGQRTFTKRDQSDLVGVGLIVIDECSMVDETIARDLLSFHIPILVLGDPGQLPPVGGTGYFTSGDPDFFLDEIHRQDLGEVRIIGRDQVDADEVLAADQIIVGTNRSRTSYNARIRQLKGFLDPEPMAEEQLICLKNQHAEGLFNGGMWRVLERKKRRKGHIDDNCIHMAVTSLDFENTQPVDIKVRREFFEGRGAEVPWQERRGTQEFDFGYAITCHKSQGSQWPSVYLFDESATFASSRAQWLYTAVTRAAERITVVM